MADSSLCPLPLSEPDFASVVQLASQCKRLENPDFAETSRQSNAQAPTVIPTHRQTKEIRSTAGTSVANKMSFGVVKGTSLAAKRVSEQRNRRETAPAPPLQG